MGRQPCCDKVGLKRGPWTIDEDQKLMSFILNNGIHCWRTVPKLAGLLRCGKSCRLRWINYLRPDLKRGDFSDAEENQLIQLHSRLGNKWSKIASHFPGRTDNEIKNHWNTRIKKRLKLLGVDPPVEEGLETDNLNSSQNQTSELELVTISQESEESLKKKVVPIEEACGARKGTPEMMTVVQPEYHHKEHNDDGDSGFESIILDELASTDLLNSYNNVLPCGKNNNLVSDTGLIKDITTNFYNNNNTTTTMSQSCSFSVEDSNNYSASVGESQDINSRYNLQQQWPLETTVDSYCWVNLDNYFGHEDFFYFQNL